MNIKGFIKNKNLAKKLFTPGPSSLSEENILGLEPCFGRNDNKYKKVEKFVISKIKKMSGQKNVAYLQGSASLALEIAVHNFVFGKVLLINTGVYSDRLLKMTKNFSKLGNKIKRIDTVSWKDIFKVKQKYDWIISCVTETSMGFKIPIKDLYKVKNKTNSKLFLDATASIGLEKDHRLGDVISFSSCKGLFGLTGASFICFSKRPKNKIKSFYFDINSHLKHLMTGPYHIIGSLYHVLKKYDQFRFSVEVNKKKFLKKFGKFSPYSNKNQPLICTHIIKKVSKKNSNTILYKPRSKLKGSIVCHLGEVHLKKNSKGNIINNIRV